MISAASNGGYTNHGHADPVDGFALPFIELALAFDVAEDGEKTWTECLRDAAYVSDGELLFVLPTSSDTANNEGEHAVLRIRSEGAEKLVFAFRDGVDTVFLDEAEADAAVAAFARTCLDVLERLRADERIITPLQATSH